MGYGKREKKINNPYYLRYIMKNTSLLLSVAALFSFAAVNATVPADADLVELAIVDHSPEAVLTSISLMHNGSYAVSKSQKEKYAKIAAEQVEKTKAKKSDHFSFDSITALDWTMMAAHTMLTGVGALAIYESFYSQDEKKNIWKGLGGVAGFLTGFGNGLRNAKDLIKHATDRATKAHEKVKNAEKIQLIIDKLPVK